MGTLIQNPDGTHVFKGGFDTKKKSDMEQLTNLIFKPIKIEEETPKKETPRVIVEPIAVPLEEVPQKNEETPTEVTGGLLDKVKEVVEKVVELKPKKKKTRKKKKTTEK